MGENHKIFNFLSAVERKFESTHPFTKFCCLHVTLNQPTYKVDIFISLFSARSPVFSHLSASLQGLHTIRAFGVQSKFIEEFDNHQDLHTEAWFLFLATSRWLAIRLDWLCAMFVTVVSFCSVLAAESK